MTLSKKFSAGARGRSFVHAGRGLYRWLATTPNAWIQLCVFFIVVVVGLYVHLARVEWMFVFLASGFVLASEAFNTAMELDMDLTSPDYHPHARDTKDIAAGAVLISSITAVGIGLFIFLPHLIP